ncbi:MAG: hypothetical protein KKB70_10345, partial [Proteobacteria bacterium]|nr:hypothetical protein [Pseudomonadota bacterium]
MLEFARTRIGQQFFYTFKTVAKALQNIAAKMPESGHLGAAHRLGEAMCRCALCEREAAEALAVGPDAVDAFREENGNWSEFPGYPIENWRYEVENGDTTLGYWEWV